MNRHFCHGKHDFARGKTFPDRHGLSCTAEDGSVIAWPGGPVFAQFGFTLLTMCNALLCYRGFRRSATAAVLTLMLVPARPVWALDDPTPCAADLAFPDAAASRSGGTIYGTLTAGRMDDVSWPRRPLPGITIRFVSSTATVETVTGDDGRFVVSGVPEGSVRIEPLLPDGLQMQSAGTDVRAGACTELSLVAEFNGRVHGVVRHADGTPMTWLVDAVPVDPLLVALGSGQRSVRANDRGDFEFAGVPPGAYLVGVNLLRPASLAEPYAPTYFPGTTARDDAVPIVVGEGANRNGIELTLHDPILNGQLQLVVLSDQGPGDVSVCMRDISTAMGKFGRTYTPSAPGEPVTITVLEGEKYQVLAHVERSTSHSESEVVEVVGVTGPQTLTLRADAEALSHPPGFNCQSFFSR
jgi:hypothetical protein